MPLRDGYEAQEKLFKHYPDHEIVSWGLKDDMLASRRYLGQPTVEPIRI